MPSETAPENSDSPTHHRHFQVPADARITPQPDEVAAHLANERTFLAWSFTALFLMGGGVALARTLIVLNTSPLTGESAGHVTSLLYPTSMGLTFLVAGLVVMVLAACRYLSVQEQIIQHRYRPTGMPVLIYLAIILFLCIVLAGFLLELRGTL